MITLLKIANIFYSLTKKADADAEIAKALMKFIAEVAKQVNMDKYSYIVGGSVRDFIMGVDPKDIDVVVETHIGDDGEKRNAATLGEAIAKTLNLSGIKADQYGVVHIGPIPDDFMYDGQNLIGQKIEIVTARKEKYDKNVGKSSHKPTGVEPGTIREDLERRDFTFNTLTWRLSDLTENLKDTPVLDVLEKGRKDLDDKIVMTPLDPSETFDDDPSRMLRAIRFAVKYNFNMKPEVVEAIRNKAEEIRRLPWEPVADIFVNKILKLGKDKAKKAIVIMDDLNILFPTLDMCDKKYLQRQFKSLPIGSDADFIMFLLEKLKKYNIENFIYKFPRELESELINKQTEMSESEFQMLYDRLQNFTVNTAKYMEKFNLKGSQIKEVSKMAREFILEDPSISNENLDAALNNYFESRTNNI